MGFSGDFRGYSREAPWRIPYGRDSTEAYASDLFLRERSHLVGGELMSDNDLKHTLETLVDQTSVVEVLRALADVCYEKSEHIRTTWNDQILARLWERSANQIQAFSTKIHFCLGRRK
jgi:hypothetical protein